MNITLLAAIGVALLLLRRQFELLFHPALILLEILNLLLHCLLFAL